jgi:hypothetical protein
LWVILLEGLRQSAVSIVHQKQELSEPIKRPPFEAKIPFLSKSGMQIVYDLRRISFEF